ncbi:MAG: VWA domain-containing protein [Planctomycetota bacterium]|nr:VWA domain-containing protein [Planctomycetota bacterium]
MSPALLFLGAGLVLLAIVFFFHRLRPQEKIPWGLALAAVFASAIFSGFTIPATKQQRLRIFIVDGSLSFRRGHESFQGKILESCADLGKADLCALVVFGQSARVLIAPISPDQFDPDSVDWNGEQGSHIEKGVEAALALSSPESQRELILFSDGLETEGSLLKASALCRERGVKLFTYCPNLAPVKDIALSALTGPSNVPINAELEFSATVINHSPNKVDGRLEFTAYNGQTQHIAWALGIDLSLAPRQTLSRRILRRVKKPGLYRLEARLFRGNAEDSFEQNNRQTHWFTVGSPKKAIIVCSPKSHGPRLITSAGFQSFPLYSGPDLKKRFQAAIASSPDILVIDDQSLDMIAPIVSDIDALLAHHGVGLLVFGGPNAFGPGNYSGSSFEKLLPVSSDPPSDPGQALTLSMAIDASGSMKDRYPDALEFGIEKTFPLLRSGDKIHISAFAESVRLRKENLDRAGLERALIDLRELEPNDGTDLNLALTTLFNDLIAAPVANKKLAVLVTDAQAKINEEQRAALRKQARKLADQSKKSGAQIVLLLIGEVESLEFLKSLESDLTVDRVKTMALSIRNTKSALKNAISSSLARVREEVAKGRFNVEITELGKGFLGSRPIEGVITAYNRTRPKSHAQSYARTRDKKEALVTAGDYGAGKVLTFTSSLSLWLGPLIQSKSGRSFLTQLPSLVRNRVNRSWKVTAKRIGSQVVVRARHPSVELAGASRASVIVSDGQSRKDFLLVPTRPGWQQGECEVPDAALTLSIQVAGETIGVLTLPGTENAEFLTFEAELEKLSEAAVGSGGKRLTALPFRPQDLEDDERGRGEGRRSLGPMFALALALTLVWIAAGAGLPNLSVRHFFSNK